jgi:hypothetical protein
MEGAGSEMEERARGKELSDEHPEKIKINTDETNYSSATRQKIPSARNGVSGQGDQNRMRTNERL